MKRAWNFSAGPAMLPEAVLQRIASELLDTNGSGMSAMEMSHRGKEFLAIAEQAEADLRELMAIPDDYRVLFLQGGATALFATLPMNLANGSGRADYVRSGHWSDKAIREASRFCKVNVAADCEGNGFSRVPAADEYRFDPEADYVHITPNETIHGLRFPELPSVEAPLLADYSSSILSEPVNVRDYGLIYAGAQKNIGPAGLCIVIVREDQLQGAREGTPSLMDLQAQAKAGSMLNTPPTFAWYVAGLVFQWLKAEGGLTVMAERNGEKAALLYGAIDASDFYSNPVAAECRSRMNVPFFLADPALEDTFKAEAKQAGLLTLGGHRALGGLRASIYNAMPKEGVQALVDFMSDFERRYG
ncbi:3-phosphoserine/phosphohydroxythreonine transaminase [Natronospira bacteriovora]|uniref:Phosphoserine aminotransferase n=1 Tax=Natronospira bacteriovora TaxID=3069753 RepID=A0ABU0W5G2_9GAMM|nr:3-phosphoserine/phosphohydroxythreonine transaminase [Natronospira sp. AB-CW4]MDQ2069179.1 3-phosphoserine/phosphohydroxythreonine transaminase [Natronospira sp. AB-CW4]